MAKSTIHFKVGSRKPFAEESSVVGTAREAAGEVAVKRGNHRGGALFKVTSRMSTVPPVHDQAVDLARNAIEPQGENRDRNVTVRIEGLRAMRLQPKEVTKRLFDDLSTADPGAVEALRRIGLLLKAK